MAVEGKRNSAIELLRIFCMLGVIILHYNHKDIGGAYLYVEKLSVNYFLLHFLECTFIYAVDVFMIISGYFMCKRQKVNVYKPLELILRVMLYSFGIYLLNCIFKKNSFSIKSIISSLIPCNYFVILYSCVFLFVPYINVTNRKISKIDFKKLVLLFFIVFSILPFFVDVLQGILNKEFKGLSPIGVDGSMWGYNIVNFLLLYIIGSYLRLNKSEKSRKFYLFLFLVNTIVITIFEVLCDLNNVDLNIALEYCSPFVIFGAACIFRFFEKCEINNSIINFFSKGAFSVFLLHGYFIPKIRIDWACQQNAIVLLFHIFLSGIVIYAICALCHYVYDFIMKKLLQFIEKKEIQLEVGEMKYE